MSSAKQLEREYALMGYKLEKFKGFYGLGYYYISFKDIQEGYSTWMFSSTNLDGVRATLDYMKQLVMINREHQLTAKAKK